MGFHGLPIDVRATNRNTSLRFAIVYLIMGNHKSKDSDHAYQWVPLSGRGTTWQSSSQPSDDGQYKKLQEKENKESKKRTSAACLGATVLVGLSKLFARLFLVDGALPSRCPGYNPK
jgi:hypothetical protein